ncbi:Complex 1 LYR protein [Penicillium cf. griseofulvum]|nr:Complex 1 LYR protein [Penicillium cf. griseofulvum]
MARLSGLQRDVLSLYRKCLREIRNKPEVGYTTSSDVNLKLIFYWSTAYLSSYLPYPFSFPDNIPPRYRCNPAEMVYRAEFQKHLSVNKKDFSTIEYLLRKGNRQLELYATPGIRNIR